MCLILDDREDQSLVRSLAAFDVTVESARLEFGDACFEGNGQRGRCVVGFERKRLLDLVSSMHDRRLSGHQLRGMWQLYDYVFLVVEDRWRPGVNGEIEIPSYNGWRPAYSHSRNTITYRQVDSYLASLELKGNVIVIRTGTTQETAAVYASRYHWFLKKWEDHHSHDEIYSNDPAAPLHRGKALICTREPGLVEKVAAQLPGIDRKAWDVAAHFGSVTAMVSATEKEWQAIPGIGAVTAKNVVEHLRKNKNNC